MSEGFKDIALLNATRSEAKRKLAAKRLKSQVSVKWKIPSKKNGSPNGLPYSFSEKYKCRPHACICYNLTCASLRRGASVTKKHPPLRLALLLLCNVLLTSGLLAVNRHTRQNGAYE